jgi:hypothetical protein
LVVIIGEGANLVTDRKPPSYNPNARYWLNQSVARAERRLEMLHIRQQIAAIDEKLRILERCHPPQKATSEEPSEVHSAPTS